MPLGSEGWGVAGWGGTLSSGGGGGGGGSPPAISNYSPAAGSQITQYTPIAFDCTDDAGISAVIVTVVYDQTGASEVAYDGSGFTANFSALSSRSVITNGLHFVIARRGGWYLSPRIVVTVADTTGNKTVSG